MSTTPQSTSLSAQAARNLANTTKTVPQMGMITPRWFLRLLPWVDVEAGTYRLNRVRVQGEEFARVNLQVEGNQASIDAGNLRHVPLFHDVDEAVLAKLAPAFESQPFSKGDVLVKEGDDAKAFFVVASGKIEAFVTRGSGPIVLGTLGPGSYFGEVALLLGGPRTASARALTHGVVLRLNRERFESIISGNASLRAALVAKAQERMGRSEYAPSVTAGVEDESQISMTFVDYDLHPREYALSSVQTILRAHTRVTDLYRSPMDQLKEQLRLVLEAFRERQEWELLNNPRFGFLTQAAPAMRIPTRTGPPTPDDMDELLSLVWKEPTFFVAHPKAIAAFGRECTRRGVPPPTVGLFGAQFLTWRGVPIVPCDKLGLSNVNGVPSTNIMLMRVGAERQGAVGLHQPTIGDPKLPSMAIRFNGVDLTGVASYLVSLYFSGAIHTDDAVGVLENVEVGHYHDAR